MTARTTVVLVGSAAVALAGLALLLPVRGQASDGPSLRRTADDRPDLSGVWQVMNTANWDIQDHAARQGPVTALGAAFSVPGGHGVVVGNELPYQPWALEQKQQNAAAWMANDPEVKCYMPGVPRATYMPYPFQIVQTAENILIAYEFANASRIVRMTAAPESPAESWMGWSRGRWDGDTLVVDVTAQTAQTWFDRAGNFHSDAIRVTERYTPVDANTLTYEATIDDPKVFTAAWTMRMPLYRRREPQPQLFEYRCVEFAEELMYGHLRKTTE